MALNVFVEQYHQALQDKQDMVGLFIDLSRAFDTISHDILLNKLYKYGIRGFVWNRVKSYLLNKKQYVSYGSEQIRHWKYRDWSTT